MKKIYDLYLHFKQGDDFSSCGQDFDAWHKHFKSCAEQTKVLAGHSREITVVGSDVHVVKLEIEEELADKLIEAGVNLTLDEFEYEEN